MLPQLGASSQMNDPPANALVLHATLLCSTDCVSRRYGAQFGISTSWPTPTRVYLVLPPLPDILLVKLICSQALWGCPSCPHQTPSPRPHIATPSAEHTLFSPVSTSQIPQDKPHNLPLLPLLPSPLLSSSSPPFPLLP